MNIPCNDKNVKFLGEKSIVLFSQHSYFVDPHKSTQNPFVDKIRKIVGIKEEKMSHEKIVCLFFDPNWVYIRNKCP
jgi:hypothetical protein